MNMSKSFQVAIIGGGLAGLTLSIQLRKAGLAVVLFEKEKYPFHKVCGEYISMESWDFLERLGVPLSEMNLPKINHLHITAPNGNKLSHQLSLGGFGISRYTLDYELYLLAKNCGVEVIEECRVNDVEEQLIFTTQGIFNAPCIIGSWGKRSKMDASLVRSFQQPQNRRLSNYVGVKYHVQADLPNDLIELHNFRNGYCGISKIEANKYCMCYLVKGDELKNAGNNIKQLEETVLQKNPFLHRYFRSFPSLYDKPLTISQISFERKTLYENDLLMVGDSAGLITPLCGNGMSMAMHASYLLSNLLIAYFNGNLTWKQVVTNYAETWEQTFATRLKTGRFIQRLFGNELLTNAAISTLKPFPAILNWLVKQTHGKPF